MAADLILSVVSLAGVVLFAQWFVRTSCGTKALANSVPRRNNMPFYLPFVPVWFYMVLAGAVQIILKSRAAKLFEWQKVLLETVLTGICAVLITVGIIAIADTYFARRLKGFGLDFKTIGRDFVAALLNLVGVWPLILVMVLLTTLLGRLLGSPDFQMKKHDVLQNFLQCPQPSIRWAMVAFAVVVGPVSEEMVFRGLFQSFIRGFVSSAWLAIAISSAIFATAHPNFTHWPALFVLGGCMGYAYEKSGSLFRPIFIHASFNAVSIIAVLVQ